MGRSHSLKGGGWLLPPSAGGAGWGTGSHFAEASITSPVRERAVASLALKSSLSPALRAGSSGVQRAGEGHERALRHMRSPCIGVGPLLYPCENSRNEEIMILEHKGQRPAIASTARIAPNATVCGEVSIGPNTSIGFGAVISAESGPITIGANCVVMDTAVLRGVRGNPLVIGDNVLVGPRAYLTGCTVEEEAFIA